ncbi:MAG TPA: bifunctional oligoribonuclease/PAP phosphatase NrnA [Acidobacteriota bacterium]|nr:bifunctional oligoribonuclease/PAP phosphatase NrnA [Acidobacteriota bacterium]
MPFERFRAFFDAHTDFALFAHVDPDGDAIGSALALAWALRDMGRGAVVINESPVPANLKFLPGAETIRTPDAFEGARGRTFDTVIVLDCSSLDRLGPRAAALVAPNARVACVDHHVGNAGFGDPRLIVPEASATAELVHDILEACHAPITPEIAQCLYTGLASDTGAFRFQNTTPKALRLAARLVDHGAKPSEVAEQLYAQKSAGSLRILGLALASLEARADGQVSAMTISRSMFDRAEASPEDADGIVQYAKALLGARVGVLLQETAPGQVRISFRSDGSVDVNEFASRFGGGGHRVAAGAKISGDLSSVRERVLEALEHAVNGVNGGPPASRG